MFEILVVDLVHRLADPIRHSVRGDCEADVVQPLEQHRPGVVGPVLVADNRHNGDAVVGNRPVVVGSFAEEGIETLQDSLRVARRMAHPDRRAEHQDVGRQDLGTHRRPTVAVAFVRGHAGEDARSRDPKNRAAGHAVATEFIE